MWSPDTQTHKGYQAIMDIHSWPSGQITGVAVLPLRQLLVLIVQVPLELICGHEDLHASHRQGSPPGNIVSSAVPALSAQCHKVTFRLNLKK